MKSGIWALAPLLLIVAACSGRNDPDLVRFKASGGPDELALVVYDKIDKPSELGELPPPQSQVNRVEHSPLNAALTALGGMVSGADSESMQADDELLAHVGRSGVDSEIRTVLAAEDVEHRRKNRGRPLEVLANVNVYFKAYEDFSLDPEEEVRRLRALSSSQ